MDNAAFQPVEEQYTDPTPSTEGEKPYRNNKLPKGRFTVKGDRRETRKRDENSVLVNAQKLASQLKQKRSENRLKESDAELEEESQAEPSVENDSLLTARPSQQSDPPKLADLLKKCPAYPPQHEDWQPEYIQPYQKLYMSIANSFTVRQLRRMFRELGLKATSKDYRSGLIPRILDFWGWSPPRTQKERDSEETGMYLNA